MSYQARIGPGTPLFLVTGDSARSESALFYALGNSITKRIYFQQLLVMVWDVDPVQLGDTL